MSVTYKIGEAASLLNLKTYVLRFWETEFPQIVPLRTEKGQRLYTPENLALLEHIRYLLHERGLTIEGARRALAEEAAGTAHVGTASPLGVNAPVPHSHAPAGTASVPGEKPFPPEEKETDMPIRDEQGTDGHSASDEHPPSAGSPFADTFINRIPVIHTGYAFPPVAGSTEMTAAPRPDTVNPPNMKASLLIEELETVAELLRGSLRSMS